MLIVTMPDRQPTDFALLAQNMATYEVCGHSGADGYRVVDDIPPGFSQRVLPPQYGEFLTLSQIASGLLLENGELQDGLEQRVDLDFRVTMMELGLM